MMEPFLHGVILAFGLILPLGVQNIFVFHQGATHKKIINALPAVITASICDTLLILLAVTGISLMIVKLEWLKYALFFIGFLFLTYMGWLLWKSADKVNNQEDANPFSAKRQILFTLSVSLFNPHAILDTIGVIGTSSLIYSGHEKWTFTLACILISWLWFFSLAYTGKKLGQIDQNGKLLKRMNQISALIIWLMALYMGIQLI